MSNPNTKEALVHKLQAALNELKAKMYDKHIVELLNEKLPPKRGKKVFISPGYFSRIKNDRLSKFNIKTLSQIIPILEEFIQKEHEKKGNKVSKTFAPVTAFNEINPELYDRLEALVGKWIAYSWDATATEDAGLTGKIDGYIHVFKILINSLNNIKCITKNGEFTQGNVMLIGSEKIAIEIFETGRKVFLIIEVGSGKQVDLMRKSTFRLAYIDSGDTKIKAGLALIERTTEDFEKIVCESILLSKIEDELSPLTIKFLKDAQLIIR